MCSYKTPNDGNKMIVSLLPNTAHFSNGCNFFRKKLEGRNKNYLIFICHLYSLYFSSMIFIEEQDSICHSNIIMKKVDG